MKIQNIKSNNYRKQNFGQVNLVCLESSALKATTSTRRIIELSNASNKAAGEINGWISSLTTLVGLGKQTNKTLIISAQEVVESVLEKLNRRGTQFQKEFGDLLTPDTERTHFLLLTKEHKDEAIKLGSLKGILNLVKETAKTGDGKEYVAQKIAGTVGDDDIVHVYAAKDLESLAWIYKDIDM